jgi:chaperonin GroES
MNFKPTADRIVVRQIEAENTTSSGFIIPDSSVKKPNQGTVVAMGPGRVTNDGVAIPIADISIDNIVMFEQGAGTKVTVEGETYLVLKEGEIIAIVE